MRKLTKEDYTLRAKDIGFQYCDDGTKGVHENHDFICPAGCEIKIHPANLFRRKYCPDCNDSQRDKRITHEDCEAVAKKFGIKYLGREKLGEGVKLTARIDLPWECPNGHPIPGSYDNRRKGHTCKKCKASTGEKVTTQIMELLLDEKFPNTWPDWLIGLSGRRAELDGYCEKLNLAFEYHGERHYSEKYYLPRNRSLEEQQAIDEHKRKVCAAKGVKLIEVKYDVGLENIQDYLQEQLTQLGIVYKNVGKIDLSKLKYHNEDKLDELRSICESKGWILLSEEYLGDKEHVYVSCKKCPTIWDITPNNLKRDRGCPGCANKSRNENRKLKFDDYYVLAYEKGCDIDDQVFTNTNTPVKWKCNSCNKPFNRTYNQMVRLKKCPECEKQFT